MTVDRVARNYGLPPDAALDAVRRFDGPLLIDLDETLYLRSSTEDFIDSVRPAIVAYLLLRLLELLRPWRWTGPNTRDVWRIRLVLVVFPWTLLLWRRRTPDLASRFVNEPLRLAALAGPTSPIILTLGFRPVVAPLVAALGLPQAPIIASRVWITADRRDGKLHLAARCLGADNLARSLCITDSPQDQPILDACALPILTVWPQARYRPALAGLYLPGRYLTHVKRPNAQYIRRGILQDDFALWVLASVWLAAFMIPHVLGLLCLLISFWAIYEQGYVENDRMAARLEADPRLSETFGTVEVATPRLMPWLWGAVAGGAGILLVRWPEPPSLIDGVIWTTVLVATSLSFGVFNRVDKASRVWLYAGLQLARCGAFAALVPIVPVASVVIGASVIEKWIPYFLYRLPGGETARSWSLPLGLMRFMFVLVLAPLAAAQDGRETLLQWPTLMLVGFVAVRARRDLHKVVASASRIDRAERRNDDVRSSRLLEDAARVGASSS